MLYIGKKFENLQKLDVGFFGNEINVEELKFFTTLNYMNMALFRNLKIFKFYCDEIYKPSPYILYALLTVLKGSQQTLTYFELEFYRFSDVNQIVNMICSKNMPLKCVSFKVVRFLSDADIMQIAKMNNSNELQIKIFMCGRLTPKGVKDVLSYIERNKLNKQLLYDEKILKLSTFCKTTD